MTIDQSLYRDAMSRLSAAVNVITTDGPAGRHGLTASAVCSVTDTPPTLLVCVNRSARSHANLTSNGVLCVNVLSGRHQDLSGAFGNRGLGVAARFAAASWRVLATGAPVLTDASVSLDCRVGYFLSRNAKSVSPIVKRRCSSMVIEGPSKDRRGATGQQTVAPSYGEKKW
jgi:flavin reductase